MASLRSPYVSAQHTPLFEHIRFVVVVDSKFREKDLVLVGRGPMSGANITQFWVFHATDEGYDLVLQAGAHDLFVNDRMQHGFREIELQSATGIRFYTVVFRFDGKRYKVIRNTSESTR